MSMATEQAIAIREERAQQRIDKVLDKLSTLVGLPPVNWSSAKTWYTEELTANYLDLLADTFDHVTIALVAKIASLNLEIEAQKKQLEALLGQSKSTTQGKK
jgi:hypothetical protein